MTALVERFCFYVGLAALLIFVGVSLPAVWERFL